MENYAVLNEANIITNIFVGQDKSEKIDGMDPEIWYSSFNNFKCLSTSDKNGIAQIGGRYDEARNIFISLPMYPSWIFNYETLEWEAPVPKPGNDYWWDELSLSWKEDDKSDL